MAKICRGVRLLCSRDRNPRLPVSLRSRAALRSSRTGAYVSLRKKMPSTKDAPDRKRRQRASPRHRGGGATHYNGQQPKHPPPARRLDEVGPAQRPDDRPQQGPQREDGHGGAPPLHRHAVRNRPAANGQRRHAYYPVQESEDDQLRHAARHGASHRKHHKQAVVHRVDPGTGRTALTAAR